MVKHLIRKSITMIVLIFFELISSSQKIAAILNGCIFSAHLMKLFSYALQAASAVASATMTPLNVEFPPNKLLELVAKVCTFWL